MKIIVVGLGQTGVMISDLLAKERHDVIVVDPDKSKIEKVTGKYSVRGVCGSAVSKETLLKAGADTADVVLTLTNIDEINLMACRIAKSCGTRYGAARIMQPQLSNEKDELAKEFQVDYLVNPKLETAEEMIRQIGFPGKTKADAFFDDVAMMVRVSLEKGMLPKEEMSLVEIKQFFGNQMLVAAIAREQELIIPKGNVTVKTGDTIDVIAPKQEITQLVEKLGLTKKEAKNVFMVGGGDIAYYLAKGLLREKKKVTILESNKARSMELLEKLPNAKVCLADGLKEEVLLEEGLKQADVCVSVTGSDETNLVVSLFAWSQKIDSILTKVESLDYEKLLKRVSIDITVSPSVIAVNGMFGFVRNVAVYNAEGNDIKSIQQFAGGKAEAIEFIAYDHTKNLGVALKDKEFRLRKDLLIGMIIRDGQGIIPSGDSSIQKGDRVIVFTNRKKDMGLNTLNDIFEK